MYTNRMSRYGSRAAWAPAFRSASPVRTLRATPQVPCGALPCACPSGDTCVPLSSYLNSQFGSALPLALTTALATVSWPQGVSFNLGIMNPGGSINSMPIVSQFDLGTTDGGTYWDMSACAAQLELTATVALPSVTMTVATPATLSMVLTGTFSAWAQTNSAGETQLLALSATNLTLAPNPYANGQTVVGAVNNDTASTSLAALLTPLLQSNLATQLLNQVLGAVLPLPLSVGTFSLCASSTATQPYVASEPYQAMIPYEASRQGCGCGQGQGQGQGKGQRLAYDGRPVSNKAALASKMAELQAEFARAAAAAARSGHGPSPAKAAAMQAEALAAIAKANAAPRPRVRKLRPGHVSPYHALDDATVAGIQLGDQTSLLSALATYLQSQLNGGLWSTIATSTGFTLGGNPSKLDPLNLSGVVSGYGGAASCAGCTDGGGSYGNGTGTCDCPSGFHYTGVGCYRTWTPDAQTCPACGTGTYRSGALCYPNCDAGYQPFGCCICTKQIQVCVGAAGGYQLGNLTGIAGLTFATFTAGVVPDVNAVTASTTVSGNVALSGGSAWGTAAPFSVPCGESGSWQQYLPHEISISFPSVSVGFSATITVTAPWEPASDGSGNTTLEFGASTLTITNITVDPFDWASILSSIPGLSELADTINDDIASVMNGAVASAVPATVLGALGDVTLPFSMTS